MEKEKKNYYIKKCDAYLTASQRQDLLSRVGWGMREIQYFLHTSEKNARKVFNAVKTNKKNITEFDKTMVYTDAVLEHLHIQKSRFVNEVNHTAI